MHPYGPPRKFFRTSGSRGGARIPNPGGAQDFTVDQDTPPGGFHQSQPYRLPPPPVEGAPRYGFPPGPWPPFNPYPPPHYGYHPRPPGFGAPPRHWGHGGYSHQGRGGGWRGRGRGYRGRGGRYPYSKHGSDGGSSDDIDAYYSKSMFEDPWKDLLPQEGEQSQEEATPTSLNNTMPNQDGATTNNSQEQEMVASTVDTSAVKTDTDNHSEISHNVESSSSVDIDTSNGCMGTGSETGALSHAHDVLAARTDGSSNCVQEDCHSTAVVDNGGGMGSSKTVESGDHMCAASTDQEPSQIEGSTYTEVQD